MKISYPEILYRNAISNQRTVLVSDPLTPNTPDYTDLNFYDKINDIYSKYKIPSKQKTFKEFCFPEKYELQIPQKFLSNYIHPNTPYDRLLVYHKIGGGKTCVAISISENFKGKYKIIIVLPASLQGNFRNELRTLCAGENYITNKERETLKKLDPSDPIYKSIIEKSDNKINKVYNIYSYNKFIDLIKTSNMNLNDTLLIIDEIQNMVSEDGTYYYTLQQLLMNAPTRNLRLVLMTATPIFDKPVELALTMNLLFKDNFLPTGKEFINEYVSVYKKPNGSIDYKIKNLENIKRRCKGYISYFRGAPEYVFPKTEIFFVKCVMSDDQVEMYNSIIKQESDGDETVNDTMIDVFGENLSNNFYIGTRMVSNFIYPQDDNYKANDTNDEHETLKNTDFKGEKLKRLSCKYYDLLKRLKQGKGTVFIYSNFKGLGGIRSLVRSLEQNGYKNYRNNGKGLKRFAVWSGDEKMAYREEIRNIFNNKNNELGEQLQIILGTSAIKEGVSLLRVQYVHIMEPYWNMSRLEQVMGRAIRFCSHKDISKVSGIVKVYIYMAIHPTIKYSVDEKIMGMAIDKKIINGQFEKTLMEAAIDCELFKNANGPDIICAN
jgi:superfamily II DNA or RNA helicase